MGGELSLADQMLALGRGARAASRLVALASSDTKIRALKAMALRLRENSQDILAANALDLIEAEAAALSLASMDRLRLTPERLEAMAAGVDVIADLPDPVGEVMQSWTRPNGLKISRVRVPLGVIGVIYESRPNVTADAAALCFKSGNAVILRGGSDSSHSSSAIHRCLLGGLRDAGLPEEAICLVPTADRVAVGLMLGGLDGTIDVIVPRGGKSLVARVQAEARVPIFAHLEGNCHVYVHEQADLTMARDVVLNAKMRRPGICGAAETLLVDRGCASTHLAPLVLALLDAGCAVRGDADTLKVDPRVKPASEEDWSTEYLDAIMAVRVIDGLEAAIAHIAHYGSHHTDAIVTNSCDAARRFLAEVDSAIVMHNASTQFADGGEFGFGAEIGIATGRMHARGPVGVEQLCTFKYQVEGDGQLRP